MDSPEKKRLVLKRSILGWGNITVRGGRLFEKKKKKKKRGCEKLWSIISACLKYKYSLIEHTFLSERE